MVTAIHAIMHSSAVKKNGNRKMLASHAGLSEEVFSNALSTALTTERLVAIEGRYLLTPSGQMIVLSEYSRFYGQIRSDQMFVNAYTQFEKINMDLKNLITRWQTIELADKVISNDHTDIDYDNKIIDKIGNLHERYQPVLEIMISSLPRLAFYRDKLIEALEKAEDGEVQWVSDARIESYHTIWFEMHEDLLRVLGHAREE
jgi:hypothetical protein